MASAKQEAINYLGSEDDFINSAGYVKERDLANKIYETQRNAYQNEYDELLRTIANNRLNAKSDFNAGRGIIGEDAYLKDRASATDLAARGLAGGVQALGRVGNRMETGRQYSRLANTYYRTMNEIDASERTGTNQYNTNMETEKNNLASTLADVDAREAGARNQYKAAVAQLAEQIQARKDAAAQAAAQLKAYIENSKKEADDRVKSYVYNLWNDKTKKDKDKYVSAYEYLSLNGYADPEKTLSNWNIKVPDSGVIFQLTRDENGNLGNKTPITYVPEKRISNNSLSDLLTTLGPSFLFGTKKK